jgi:hypothetical protein
VDEQALGTCVATYPRNFPSLYVCQTRVADSPALLVGEVKAPRYTKGAFLPRKGPIRILWKLGSNTIPRLRCDERLLTIEAKGDAEVLLFGLAQPTRGRCETFEPV